MDNDDFLYDNDTFIFTAEPGFKSHLEDQIVEFWNRKMAAGLFRYTLGDLRTKIPEGNYGFVVQLNPNRAVQRRTPQVMSDLIMPFDQTKFHFGQVPEDEIMFNINNVNWGVPRLENPHDYYKNALIINVSPLEQLHSLFVPNMGANSPQHLTDEGLRAAIETMLCCSDSHMRMGFNSLGAFASVNHQHFHIYQLQKKLYLEDAPAEHLFGPLHYMLSYPAEGFCFQILSLEDILPVIEGMMVLVNYLVERRFPYNVFMTRGAKFSLMRESEENDYSALRIYVWARKPHYGPKEEGPRTYSQPGSRKENPGFNVAVCELSGYISAKDEEVYEEIDEDAIAREMRRTCHEAFLALIEGIVLLFKDRYNQ